MPLASRLLVRTLIGADDRLVTVVVRRRRTPQQRILADRPIRSSVMTEPQRTAAVPQDPAAPAGGFSRPVVRAIAELGGRARPVGRDGLALDGRPAALARVVSEANRSLAARGCAPIPYPGVRPKERRR